MHRTRPLPALPLDATHIPGLTLLEDLPGRSAVKHPNVTPFPVSRPMGDRDDPFDPHYSPTPAFVRRQGNLPRFVPLQPELFTAGANSLALRSVIDLFRLYLAEVSISAGLVIVSGWMGGVLAARFIGVVQPLWVMAVYASLFLLNLASVYLTSRGQPYAENKARLLKLLLGCLVLFVPHVIAFVVSRALL